MKSLLIALLSLISIIAFGQSPEAINYQAVARDGSGNILSNQSITVRFTILSGSGASTQEYQETHGVSTNDYGLFSLKVGKGAPISGTFSSVVWGSDEHHLKVEVDQGSGFIDMGTTQMMSVPYALYAETAGNSGGSLVLNDLTDVSAASPNTNQVLSWNGTAWVPITTSGGTTYSAGSGLSLTGTTFSNTAPDQTVTMNGGGATSITGTYPNFTISSTDNNTTYSGGTGLTLSGTTFNAQNTTAMWNANQLQGRIIASTTPSTNQVLGWNGSQWIPQTVSGGSSLWTQSGSTINYTTGNVGIGTSSPLAHLDVRGSLSTSNYNGINSEFTGGTTSNNYYSGINAVVNGTGLNGTNNAIQARSQGTSSYRNTSIYSYAAGATSRNRGIHGDTDGNATINQGVLGGADGVTVGQNMGVFASAQNSTNVNFAMYATTFGTSGTHYGIYAEHASGSSGYAGYFNGNIDVTGTIFNTSDMNLKENIVDVSSVLNSLRKVRVTSYNYKNVGDASRLNLAEGNQIGFIAQDLRLYFPHLVKEQTHPSKVNDNDEISDSFKYQGVNYIGMIPVLTKAIQEQQELIEKLEKRILELENK